MEMKGLYGNIFQPQTHKVHKLFKVSVFQKEISQNLGFFNNLKKVILVCTNNLYIYFSSLMHLLFFLILQDLMKKADNQFSIDNWHRPFYWCSLLNSCIIIFSVYKGSKRLSPYKYYTWVKQFKLAVGFALGNYKKEHFLDEIIYIQIRKPKLSKLPWRQYCMNIHNKQSKLIIISFQKNVIHFWQQ